MKRKTYLLIALILFLLLLPAFAGKYLLYMTIHILILSVFALGFNLLLGYTGLLSFGQAGFFAVGAYASAKILLVVPSLLLGTIIGTITGGIVALILGYLCIRHTRIYFSMLTLSFGMMVYSLAWKWREVTGGDDGLVGIPRAPLEIPGIFSINMNPMENYYYFVLIVSIMAIFFIYRIVNSPFGLTLKGIRDSENRVAFAGVSIRAYRLLSFVIAGLYAGLAGSFLPPLENTVTPPIAHWTHSAEPVMVTLLGGIHTFSGPIVGSILFYIIKDIIVRFTQYWLIVFGSIVILLVLVFRGGVVIFFSEKILPLIKRR
ncbi:MAG: branched-chain amino acid ABC transporter permease [Deltaproteobacteria bacterium]|nr:branched-chain amino acid ABC transporter permease [Deltaproteobacteria bacterium]MBM4323270.1 branched-chain amino acid ABC transporter permease [Deltaproteobacteria bacterium]